MTDQEKNEALARWAGFKGEGGEFCHIAPDGTEYAYYPDFLHSLDAQAKWLWKEVTSRFGPDALSGIFNAVFFNHSSDMTFAEACAEAILALIEAEKAVVA